MRSHVSDETVAELAMGGGDAFALRHVATCGRCARRVSEQVELLALLRPMEVPEPPAAYWPALVRAIGRRIDAEPRRGGRWRWLVPVAAVTAGVLAAVAPARAPLARPDPPRAVAQWSALPPLDEDTGAPLLEAAGGPVVAALDEGRGLDSFVAGLTEDEAAMLAENLRGAREGGDL